MDYFLNYLEILYLYKSKLYEYKIKYSLRISNNILFSPVLSYIYGQKS